MKTKLIIDEDLKKYLYKEKDRTNKDTEVLSRTFKRENFDMQWIFKFNNNYGVSVIKSCCGSWGFDDDLFELAVIRFNTEDEFYVTDIGDIETPIGYLSNSDVMELLYRIKELTQIKGEDCNEN